MLVLVLVLVLVLAAGAGRWCGAVQAVDARGRVELLQELPQVRLPQRNASHPWHRAHAQLRPTAFPRRLAVGVRAEDAGTSSSRTGANLGALEEREDLGPPKLLRLDSGSFWIAAK